MTICPNEQSPPDNWAFLEKVLNGVAISKSNVDIWQDILQPIKKQLFDRMEEKFGSNPTSPMWASNQDNWQEFVRESIKASQLICKNKISSNDLKTMTEDELANLMIARTKIVCDEYNEISEIPDIGWTLSGIILASSLMMLSIMTEPLEHFPVAIWSQFLTPPVFSLHRQYFRNTGALRI